MTVGDLVAFATAYPAPEGDADRRDGELSGFPRCCVEFYAALIPFWFAGEPPAIAYWLLANRILRDQKGRGYFPCPECPGVPLAQPLDFAAEWAARRRFVEPQRA
jgi:hypothetical protein